MKYEYLITSFTELFTHFKIQNITNISQYFQKIKLYLENKNMIPRVFRKILTI